MVTSGSIFTPSNPVKPIKFDSTSYIPTPNNWETNTDVEAVRQNASIIWTT